MPEHIVLFSHRTDLVGVAARLHNGPRCPACNAHLRIEGTGIPLLVCASQDCPRPTAASEILCDPQGTAHVVRLHDAYEGFSVKHPLIERLDSELLRCQLGRIVAQHGESWVREDKGPEWETDYLMWLEDGQVRWHTDSEGYPVEFRPGS